MCFGAACLISKCRLINLYEFWNFRTHYLIFIELCKICKECINAIQDLNYRIKSLPSQSLEESNPAFNKVYYVSINA